MTEERRHARSEVITDALSLWLNSVARRAGAEVLVLSDEAGKAIVANATGADSQKQSERTGETAMLPIPTFRHDNQGIYLWSRGPRGAARMAVKEAEPGLLRILGSHF